MIVLMTQVTRAHGLGDVKTHVSHTTRAALHFFVCGWHRLLFYVSVSTITHNHLHVCTIAPAQFLNTFLQKSIFVLFVFSMLS